ncbi:hypothetical protein [Paenibacillus sp. GCM10027626]|uniref:hypothetical protein n=1 Tax=Paenibacillus sp. GCM10027626 TaxID=3273411 RepID=UPI00363D71A9
MGKDEVQSDALDRRSRNRAYGAGGSRYALWDIMAKAAAKPLWQYLDGHKAEKIKAYNTNGGWLNWSKERLIADMTSILEEGFTASSHQQIEPSTGWCPVLPAATKSAKWILSS